MNGARSRTTLWTSRLGWMLCCALVSADGAESAVASGRALTAGDSLSRERGPLIVLAALPDATPMDGVYPSRARRGGRQRLAAGGVFAVGDVHGAAGAAIPISVALPRLSTTDFTLLTIRGLPKTFSLSSGFRFEDSWAVSLADVDGLSMLAPASYSGRFTLEIQLIAGQQQQPEKLTVPVEIKPSSAGFEAVASVRSPAGFPGGAAALGGVGQPAPAKVSAKEETTMMERGGRLLQTGDVAAARMLFERLARRGSAKGAYAAGRTYDPEFLKSVRVVGLAPNVKKAKDWYARAAALEQPEAAQRLGRP